jgi:hypothetical protein
MDLFVLCGLVLAWWTIYDVYIRASIDDSVLECLEMGMSWRLVVPPFGARWLLDLGGGELPYSVRLIYLVFVFMFISGAFRSLYMRRNSSPESMVLLSLVLLVCLSVDFVSLKWMAFSVSALWIIYIVKMRISR